MTNALQLIGRQFEFMLYGQKIHGVTAAAACRMNEMMLKCLTGILK